jgi:hypothetical protein
VHFIILSIAQVVMRDIIKYIINTQLDNSQYFKYQYTPGAVSNANFTINASLKPKWNG